MHLSSPVSDVASKMTQNNKTPSSNGSGAKSATAYSCVRCFDRKVKCSRDPDGCSNCIKSGVDCLYRVPPAPRRRKKRTQEEILKARLDHYEQILRNKGIDIRREDIKAEDLPETSPEPVTSNLPQQETQNGSSTVLHAAAGGSGCMMPNHSFVNAKLIVDHGRTRFVENNLWTSVSEEFRKPSDAMPEESDDEDSVTDEATDYVLGPTPSSQGVSDMHPFPEQILLLWQIFLDNVNPLSKLIHVPSLQPAIIEATSHLDRLPRNFEALLFSIYNIAITSLRPDECRAMLGESRNVLLSRYRSGTKRALARAKFLGTSDLMVLQAFVLHLLAMREIYDAKTLWTLTGVGNRIAEGMGVHRDGSSLGLGPFETELRRRVWWQLIFLDFRTAELSGSGNYGNVGTWDCHLPSNVNDADIWPGMKEPPDCSERGTEMIFCLTRYELGQFWKRKLLTREPEGDFTSLWSNFKKMGSIEEKERGIQDLEQLLERKYVRFCDPSVPVEFMSMLVTRSATNGMRLMAHHPRRYARDEDVPESERKLLWTTALKLIELDNLIHASKSMLKFKWHTDAYFQWQSLIYALTEMRKHPLEEYVDRGWTQINEVFQNHPDFVTDLKKPINFAAGSLCLKAWKAREETWSQRTFQMPLATPDYIKRLQIDREEKKVPPPKLPTTLDQRGYFATAMDSRVDLPRRTPSPRVELPVENAEQMPQQFQYIPQPQQNELPPQLHFPQEIPQPFFWWDYTKTNEMIAEPNFDSTFLGLAGDGQDNMDWSQWDFLLKDVRPAG